MTSSAESGSKGEVHRLPKWVTAIAFIVLVGFLVLVGLGLRRSQAGPIVIGQKVPDFVLHTFANEQLDTADMKGKVVVVNFWASWCKPCEQEAFELEAAWQNYKPQSDVVFLGVAWVDTEPESKAFINQFGISYPNGPDLRTRIGQMFRLTGVPETYIIDREGRLAYVKKGPFLSISEIQAAINPLLP